MTVYVGLDLSLTGTGLGRLRADSHGDIDFRTVACTTITNGKLKGLDRVERIVSEVIKWVPPGAVVAIEGYSMNSVHRGYDIAEMTGAVKHALYRSREALTVLIVAPNTLKLHATGRGDTLKPKMYALAKEYFLGIAVENDNEGDALYLAEVAKSWHIGTSEPHRVRALEKVFPVFPPRVKKL